MRVDKCISRLYTFKQCTHVIHLLLLAVGWFNCGAVPLDSDLDLHVSQENQDTGKQRCIKLQTSGVNLPFTIID